MNELSPRDFWEDRYADSERVWSGRVNPALSSLVTTLAPGRALDLGCGEGGDVIWLATQGWRAFGIDISETAVRRARSHAELEGKHSGKAEFLAADLPEGIPDESFDLISASFLQSPVELDRQKILHAAASRVAVGGHLLMVSHATAPPWAKHKHGPSEMPTLEGELQVLQPAGAWDVEVAEVRHRDAVGPDGGNAVLEDLIVLARKVRASA